MRSTLGTVVFVYGAVAGRLCQDAAESGVATGYNLVAVPVAAGALAWAGITLAPAAGRS